MTLSYFAMPSLVVLLVSLVSAVGLSLGKLQWRGLHMGVAGCLFSGLLMGHFIALSHSEILDFLREFGLMLFVYCVGVDIGPGFVAAVRSQGLKFNAMAIILVCFGMAITLIICKFMGWPAEVGLGLFSGATTNTPSLGAGQSLIADLLKGSANTSINQSSMAYAVTYPFGILGIIISIYGLRFLLKINLAKEISQHSKENNKNNEHLESINVLVTNKNMDGIKIREIPAIESLQVIISRVKKPNGIEIGVGRTEINIGDIIHAVGYRQSLEKLSMILGDNKDIDVKAIESPYHSKTILISTIKMAGKKLLDLDAIKTGQAICTRVSRSGVEFVPSSQLHLEYGDKLTVVSTDNVLRALEVTLGNSKQDLKSPQMIPVFVGLFFGVLLGSISIPIYGIPMPLKLGLAGGPLLIGILFSYLRNVGPLVWYLPTSSNLVLREMGIAIFLSVVGLKSGHNFWPTLIHGDGLLWMLAGAAITLIPLLTVGLIAQRILKINYLSTCGILAGACTDPPALAFINTQSTTNTAAIAYATVYPVAMTLRILLAQVLITLLISL